MRIPKNLWIQGGRSRKLPWNKTEGIFWETLSSKRVLSSKRAPTDVILLLGRAMACVGVWNNQKYDHVVSGLPFVHPWLLYLNSQYSKHYRFWLAVFILTQKQCSRSIESFDIMILLRNNVKHKTYMDKRQKVTMARTCFYYYWN